MLQRNAQIKFDVLEHHKRPISAVADFNEIRNVISVNVEEKTESNIVLLFDKEYCLDDRIMKEQFSF
jgi:NAD+ kinase